MKVQNKFPEGWEMKDIFEEVFLNRYGYYELREKNSQEQRGQNFEENYFQNYNGSTYAKEYSPEELLFTQNKIAERYMLINQNFQVLWGTVPSNYSLLDIGCGEGFLMQYFFEKGIRVKGIDFGSYAMEHFHPQLLPFLEKGEMESILPKLAERGETWDVINMDRVLDMVTDAEKCVDMLRPLMTDRSLLVIKVANNYSHLQQALLKSGVLKKEYWLDKPDHTGYFNREGLCALLKEKGFEMVDFYGDTFVDFWLVNPWSNYYERSETGKEAHQATVYLENLFHTCSIEDTLKVYRTLGNMGFGREIVGIFRKNQ